MRVTSIANRLALDFGTSHTVAMLARTDGRVEPLLFDSSPLLPSAVFAGGDGRLLVGRDAERSARADPARYEPNPKRHFNDGTLLLGDAEVPIIDACAAVLRRVREEAARTLGGTAPPQSVLTYPAGWGPRRRAQLVEAANAAGILGVELVTEPVAAAAYFTIVLGHQVRPGGAIVVYDFGGGTVDVSVVRRTGPAAGHNAWEVAAADGLADLGGVDLDAAVVQWAQRTVSPEDPAWRRLRVPKTAADRRHHRHLWDDARAVKEQLSRATTADLSVPLLDLDAHLTREEYEAIARPLLDSTVRLACNTITASGVGADQLTGVFLVGGSSRTPLVATMLHRALRLAPVVIEQPELVVAHGALASQPLSVPTPPPTPPPRQEEAPAAPTSGGQAPAEPRQRPKSHERPQIRRPASFQSMMAAQPSVRPAAKERAPSAPPASFQKLTDEFSRRSAEQPSETAPPRRGRDVEADGTPTAPHSGDGVVVLTVDWPVLCSMCRGTGIADGARQGTRCDACSGSGMTDEMEQRPLKVRLPNGVSDGQRIRLAGRGHPSPDPGGPVGDLLIQVTKTPQRDFEASGDNYRYTLDVTEEQARSGAVVTVPTADGTVQIRLPVGVSDGRKLRVPGKGAKPGGALVVTIRIR